MQIAITTFDNEGRPRTVKFAPKQMAAEGPLLRRFFPTLQTLSKAATLMVDTVSTPEAGPSVSFNDAFLRLYLDADAMAKLEKNPQAFSFLMAKYLPQPPKEPNNG